MLAAARTWSPSEGHTSDIDRRRDNRKRTGIEGSELHLLQVALEDNIIVVRCVTGVSASHEQRTEDCYPDKSPQLRALRFPVLANGLDQADRTLTMADQKSAQPT